MPAWPAIKAALTERPELVAVRAEIARADADVQVMRDMYRPMATIRTGPAYTMAEGRGWMAMVGVSLPIWRGKLRAGVAEAQAMRAMSEAELRAMTRMIEGDAAVAVHQVRAARDRQSAHPHRRPAAGADGDRARRGRLHVRSAAARQRH